ncbi:hypothetical protein [Aliivibrio sp. SR45-2]|uniref:hypothetical protein n=1 Tax=Aliivibrio sp. SR45-2 TaxID=2760931 RepID=UPI0015F7DA51|nr:hypothetical protein [Aliivibrio sp. SR45-2]MBB1312526.1 hypothetical protein [Aliivibrio sp. SR45-2]
MSQLKKPEQFYQESLVNLEKATKLYESMEATERKTVALFSRFIDGTASRESVCAAGEVIGYVENVEQQAIANLEAIKSRDVFAVINSIVAMTLDVPKALTAMFNTNSMISSFSVIVWGAEDETLLHDTVNLTWEHPLKNAIALESKLAELIIAAKDSEEVTA